MKPILTLTMFTLGFYSHTFCQKLDSFPYNEKMIVPGDTFQLAKGSLNALTYGYVFIDQSRLTSNTRIGAQFDGAVVIIKQLKREKINKKEIVTASLLGLEPFKVKCYLKEALDSKELIVYKKR